MLIRLCVLALMCAAQHAAAGAMVRACFDHTIALGADGRFFEWGDFKTNNAGGFAEGFPIPIQRPSLPGTAAISAVACSAGSSFLLREDGSIWRYGYNFSGQLASSDFSIPFAQPIEGLPPIAALEVSLGNSPYVVALDRAGQVWGWGDNSYGQIASPPSNLAPVNVPQRIAVPTSARIVALAAGVAHALALDADGKVWIRGREMTLARQVASDHASFEPVSGLPTVIAIAANGFHSFAIASDRTLWAWGDNSYGALGIGLDTESGFGFYHSPVRVPGLAEVRAVAAGGGHTFVLLGNGSVWGWGSNDSGELGLGVADRALEVRNPRPVRIALLGSIAQLAAGPGDSFAITASGAVFAWGMNFAGRLGDGTFAGHAAPAVVIREAGAGSLATNDWFLDLNPGVGKTIPSEKIPAFLLTASATGNSVRADVQFRSRDIGRGIRIFAYAPSSIVKGARRKDGPQCVLAQLTASGLEQVSASNLQLAGNVIAGQRQAVSVVENIAALPGATVCVGAGATGNEAVDPANSQCVVTNGQSGQDACLPPASSASLPGSLSGLWWNAAESGWGINFTQRQNIVFTAWYTYDAAGNPKWYVMPRCALPAAAASGSCSDTLYEVNGPAFFGAAFNPSAAHVTVAGSMQLSFGDADAGSITYTLAGVTRTVAIARQPFPVGTTPPPLDYTDLWWNAAESGWGLAITHRFNVMFLAWYVYDANGKPVWYVASNCNVNESQDGCTGTLYRTTGPAFGSSFNSLQVQAFEAGSASLRFTDPNNATLTYSVNGVSATKTITRQVF